MVYEVPMKQTKGDIDQEACALVMSRYHLATKEEAVNFALRLVAAGPLSIDEARLLRESDGVPGPKAG